MKYQFLAKNLEDTAKLAKMLANYSCTGDIFCLNGDLGAGKTAFAKFFIQHLTTKNTVVASPTFSIMQTYFNEKLGELYHMDLYRINSLEDLFELGIEEILANYMCLIEWSDKLGVFIPKNSININIAVNLDSSRLFTILFNNEQYERFIKQGI